jgi:GAF domain-containing protein
MLPTCAAAPVLVLLCESEQSCQISPRRVSEMDSTKFAAVLQRAAAIVGGPDLLCARLRVPPDLLRCWLTGQRKAPAAIFLQVADIISAYADEQLAAQTRHEGVIAQSLAVTSQNALVRLMSRETRQENQIIRQEAIRLRKERYVSESECLTLPSHRPLLVLDPAFVPDTVTALVTASLKAALIAAKSDLGNVHIIGADGALHLVAHQGFEVPFLDFFSVVSAAESTCGVAKRDRKQIVVTNVRSDPLFAGTPAGSVMLEAGSEAVESTPLIDEQSGVLMGIISTHHRCPGRTDQDELALLNVIGRRAASWLEPTLS